MECRQADARTGFARYASGEWQDYPNLTNVMVDGPTIP